MVEFSSKFYKCIIIRICDECRVVTWRVMLDNRDSIPVVGRDFFSLPCSSRLDGKADTRRIDDVLFLGYEVSVT